MLLKSESLYYGASERFIEFSLVPAQDCTKISMAATEISSPAFWVEYHDKVELQRSNLKHMSCDERSYVEILRIT